MTMGYIEDRIAKLEMEIQNLQEEHEALVEGVRYLRNEIAKNQTVDAEPVKQRPKIDIERFKQEIADYTDESGYVDIPLSVLIHILYEVTK